MNVISSAAVHKKSMIHEKTLTSGVRCVPCSTAECISIYYKLESRFPSVRHTGVAVQVGRYADQSQTQEVPRGSSVQCAQQRLRVQCTRLARSKKSAHPPPSVVMANRSLTWTWEFAFFCELIWISALALNASH